MSKFVQGLLWRICCVSYKSFVLLQEVSKTHSRVCIKDSVGYNGQRNDVMVNYLVIGGTSRSQIDQFRKSNKRKINCASIRICALIYLVHPSQEKTVIPQANDFIYYF